MKERRHHSPEQKTIILRELLENNIPISQVAEKYNVAINDIYNWKKRLFESAPDVFKFKSKKQPSLDEEKINKLKEKLKNRDEAITFLLTENIELKKNLDGEI
jgi:transposase